jgi:polyhydroxyalkanoate synthesis repressor PhaR
MIPVNIADYFRSKVGESAGLATKKPSEKNLSLAKASGYTQCPAVPSLCLKWCIAADFAFTVRIQEFSLPVKPPVQPIPAAQRGGAGRSAKSAKSNAAAAQKAPTTGPQTSDLLAAVRTIKKYPNRRLYDTQTSTYVTLAEIKLMVMLAQPVMVVDAKTGDNLTRAIMLQIILEEESAGVPMFSEAVLCNIIRFYGHAMQGHMGSYLESHVQSFMDWQSKLGESSPALSPEVWAQFMKWQTPMMQNMFSGLANPSQNLVTQMQDQMQKQIQKNTEQMLGVLGFKP